MAVSRRILLLNQDVVLHELECVYHLAGVDFNQRTETKYPSIKVLYVKVSYEDEADVRAIIDIIPYGYFFEDFEYLWERFAFYTRIDGAVILARESDNDYVEDVRIRLKKLNSDIKDSTIKVCKYSIHDRLSDKANRLRKILREICYNSS